MQKRSHKLLASALLARTNGFSAKRYEWAFLFGSFQPDCNPLTYLKGSLRAYKLKGHNFSNSQHYINAHIQRLQQRERWTVWQYYTLGKLTHYLADAFTYPHNENYREGLLDHRQYETALRLYFARCMAGRCLRGEECCRDLPRALDCLHRRYLRDRVSMEQDVDYILEATTLLMEGCHPASGLGKTA